tara:strand:+ start:3012 stop:3206 length:195 start_codon:yes stop_codon:yes gene_type:complete
MDIFIALLIGFGLGSASVWLYVGLKVKDTGQEELDYNMIEKSLEEFVDSKYDPENYLGQGEGTK